MQRQFLSTSWCPRVPVLFIVCLSFLLFYIVLTFSDLKLYMCRLPYQLGGVGNEVPDDGVATHVTFSDVIQSYHLNLVTLNDRHTGLGHDDRGPHTWKRGSKTRQKSIVSILIQFL